MKMIKKKEPELDGVDKGWSWIIVFACFFVSFVLAGIFRSAGVLFVAFISTYGVTREAASWPMVVCIAVLNLTGPFSGMLGQRFGIRPTVITGALIATIGIASCYFTTSLTLITVLFGGIFGVGYGFINTLTPVILNSYFVKFRATANGIANSGSCFGSMALPIAFEYLISAYELSGCFLLTGGIVLHLTIAGALMRPPPWMKNKVVKKKDVSLENESSQCYKSLDDNCELDDSKQLNPLTEDRVREYESSKLASDPAVNSLLECNGGSNASRRFASFTSEESTTSIMSSTIASSFASVLTCPMFYVTAFTNVCFYFLFHMYVVIIVDYALDRGVLDVDTKNILFAFALSDLFGRLGLGWITDRKFISRSRFVMLCMLLIGITFFAFPYANGYIPLIIVSSLYGLLLGCTMIVFPILLVDFCGIELHAVAYGCMCFMNGFASFARPFLIGYFRDFIGSYSSMFYILGTLSVASSALWLLETYFMRKRQVVQTKVDV